MEACKKFTAAMNVKGYQAHLSYNIALCHYYMKQYALALKNIADIIERGIRYILLYQLYFTNSINFFLKNPDFSNFSGKSKKIPDTDPYPEYPLLKGKTNTKVQFTLLIYSFIVQMGLDQGLDWIELGHNLSLYSIRLSFIRL